MRTRIVCGLLLGALSGCAHEEEPRVGPSQAVREAMERDAAAQQGDGNTVMVDGYKMWRERWDEDSHTIRQKASFDLGCEKLQLHVLELMTGPGRDDWAQSIGVVGCGARARYTRIIRARGREELWLLESKTIDRAPPPAPPPSPTNSL